jgi:hypothetical protein
MRGPEAFALFVCAVLIVWVIVAGLRGVFRWIFGGNSAPEMPPNQWEQAVQTISQPQQMPDGRWMQAELAWKPCDAPIGPNTLDVHDTSDPRHNPKTCPHCRPLKGYSGVSFRPTNQGTP